MQDISRCPYGLGCTVHLIFYSDAPESTHSVPMSTTTSSTLTSSSSIPSPHAASATSTTSAKSNNTGVIVGSVIGALIIVGLAAFGVTWLYFRNRRQNRASGVVDLGSGMDEIDKTAQISPPPLSQYSMESHSASGAYPRPFYPGDPEL